MITLKTKIGYYLKFVTPQTIKLLKSTKIKIAEDKNDWNVPHLEITEVVLIQCNIVNNDYQHDPRVLYTFIPKKYFGQLLDISLKKFTFSKTFDSEFSYIEVCFTDQNSKTIENELKIILVIN